MPMASSLLTVWQPEVHTVIDVRAVNSLVKNQEIPVPGDKYPPYMEYLTVCKAISQRCCRISESWTAPYTPRTDALSCRAPPSLQLDSLGNTIRACTKLSRDGRLCGTRRRSGCRRSLRQLHNELWISLLEGLLQRFASVHPYGILKQGAHVFILKVAPNQLREPLFHCKMKRDRVFNECCFPDIQVRAL